MPVGSLLNPLGIGALVYADWCTSDAMPSIHKYGEASPGFICEVFLGKEKEKENKSCNLKESIGHLLSNIF